MRQDRQRDPQIDRVYLRSRPGPIVRTFAWAMCGGLLVAAVIAAIPFHQQRPDVVLLIEALVLAWLASRQATSRLEIRTAGVVVRGLVFTFVVRWSDFDSFVRERWLLSPGRLLVRTNDGHARPINVIGALPAEQNLAKEEMHRLELASRDARRAALDA